MHDSLADVTPVILCGGSGTRLWPLSRRSRPKQFVRLSGGASLFQQALARAGGMRPPLASTSAAYRFAVSEQMAAAGVEGTVLVEPAPRDTGPACLSAALRAAPDDLLLVTPSDHALDAAALAEAVRAGVPAARAGRIVTFGVPPDRPETGFGYLEPDGPGVAPLRRFVEKPDDAAAAALIEAGCLWNAGLFLFEAGTLLEAARAHAPEMLEAVAAAWRAGAPRGGYLWPDAALWEAVPGGSVDRAIMERADALTVVPLAGAGWSDLGDWLSVWREGARGDPRGNATSGDVTAIDCDRSLLRVEREGQVMVGLGLRDVVAVSTPDAVLVADRRRMQEVRAAVASLERLEKPQAVRHRIEHRPWGHFESLARGDGFQVKRIVVRPGGVLSLQSHRHRSEHWVVVEGQATVTCGDAVRVLEANQSIYVPAGERHRLENAEPVPMTLIEVQTGTYLGEDDIVRHEDAYARD